MPEKSRQDGLQGLANLATLANYFQLRSIEQQTEEMKGILAQQQRQVQYQSYLKQFLFEMHGFIEKKLPDISDGVVSRMAVDKYLFRVKNENISSASFDSIQDKAYFEETFAMLQKERDSRTMFEAEAKEAEADFMAFWTLNNLQTSFADKFSKATPGFSLAIVIGAGIVAKVVLPDMKEIVPIVGMTAAGLLWWLALWRKKKIRKEAIDVLREYADGLTDDASVEKIESAFAKLIRHYSKRVETHRIKHPTLSLLDSV
jgi:hypothetical protein